MEKVLFADTFTKTFKDIMKVPPVVIDDPIFRLHYKFTGLALLFASIIVSGSQFFGNPIMCIQKDDIPENLLNTYCWIEGTFTLPKSFTKKVGTEVVYAGVDKFNEGDDVIEHAYYQWVCFLLFLQSILFCVPYMIWRASESGKLLGLMQKLRKPVITEKEMGISYQNLAIYFQSMSKENNTYALKYVICEVLNFVNVIGQILLVDRFLGGQFSTFGTEVVKFVSEEQTDRVDPMIRVFPRITKCTFHKYGSSGDVQKHDALCILPLNIINEKIFIVMWFWFIILAILGGGLVVFRLISLLSRRAQFVLLDCASSLTPSKDVAKLVEIITYGDWFVLYFLADNVDNRHFCRFIQKLKEYPRFKMLNVLTPEDIADSQINKPKQQESLPGTNGSNSVKERVKQFEGISVPDGNTLEMKHKEKEREAKQTDDIPLVELDQDKV